MISKEKKAEIIKTMDVLQRIQVHRKYRSLS